MSRVEDRELLRIFVGAMADLVSTTTQLLDEQLASVRGVSRIESKFKEASNKTEFWQSVEKDLSPTDVAALLSGLSRLSELSRAFGKLATLKGSEQDRVVKEYRDLAKALGDLKTKLSK
ncbi:MAG: hypothetical protein OK474_08420 [Thaumarchaeota archaeon]|nr:hypothetical protein [Nitrososphaerota archaeon]